MADEEKPAGSGVQPPPIFDTPYSPSTSDSAHPSKPQSSNFRTFIVAFLATVVAMLLVVTAARSHPLAGLSGEESSGPKKITYCAGVTTSEQATIFRAVGEMRRTKEGNHLANEILGKSVCFGVEEIAYNGGYFSMRTGPSGPAEYRIIIDRTVLQTLTDEENGALLVHEAAHAHRAFAGTNCGETEDCALLPNGIAISEEVAAHAAEARFWIEIHGSDDTLSGNSYYDNLTAAYQEGPEVFRAYVIELRSDSREGLGI
jgi:hypothetical protein